MLLLRNGLRLAGSVLRTSLPPKVHQTRFNSESVIGRLVAGQDVNTGREKGNNDSSEPSKIVTYDVSMRYMESKAYKKCYGDEPVWKPYRRNHGGARPPRKTRRSCIRNGEISTSSPCPICRDEYLVLDYRNTKLLQQFTSDVNGEIISYSKTGLCQKKHRELILALLKAKDYGTLTFDPPIRQYDYSEWSPYGKKLSQNVAVEETDSNQNKEI